MGSLWPLYCRHIRVFTVGKNGYLHPTAISTLLLANLAVGYLDNWMEELKVSVVVSWQLVIIQLSRRCQLSMSLLVHIHGLGLNCLFSSESRRFRHNAKVNTARKAGDAQLGYDMRWTCRRKTREHSMSTQKPCVGSFAASSLSFSFFSYKCRVFS